MAFDEVAYILSKKHTDETAKKFGGLKGANCKVKSVIKSGFVNTVTFEWKNDNDEVRESTMDVFDGTQVSEVSSIQAKKDWEEVFGNSDYGIGDYTPLTTVHNIDSSDVYYGND